jgi:hypothetical protein
MTETEGGDGVETREADVDRTVVWRVGFAANHHTRDDLDVERHPFADRLAVLVWAHETFHDREEQSWRTAAVDAGAVPSGLVEPAVIEGRTTVSLERDLLDRLDRAVRVEYPDRDTVARSANERIELLVTAWNGYHARTGVGWQP